MPFLLGLDISCLSLSLALSGGLALAVSGAGLNKPLNRSFVLFTTMQAGFVVCSLLLRLSLHFKAGNPGLLLELAAFFFALTAPFLFLFCVRFTRLRGWWPIGVIAAVVAVMLGFAGTLFSGKLLADPWISAEGLVFYRITPEGLAVILLPTACLLASFVLLAATWRSSSTPPIASSVGLLAAGFLVGGVLEPRFPVMAITNMVSVVLLGWGIIARQLFNPLRELTADLRERAHRQELISQISRRTATLMRIDELLGQAATLIRDSFDYFTVAVFLVSGDELVLRASTHPAAPRYLSAFRLKIGREGICGWVAAAGRPLVVGDVSRDPRYVALLDSERTRSELAVPILRSDRVIGVLDVQSGKPDAFGEMDVLTQQTIADQLSSAIENARLYEETGRRAERLALVNRISSAAGAVLDLDDLLETVHREVTPIFEADAFFIALLDESGDTLDFRIQVDEGLREPPLREPLGSGLTSRVAATRKPLLLNGRDALAGSGGFTPLRWGTGKDPSSWIGVPMLIGERLIGVMSVQTYRARRYDTEDLLLATTIADQVAVAVENARLYQKVTRELDVRLRTEKVLRESEEKFRNLAEQSPNIIFIFVEERIAYANRQSEISLGYPRESLYAPGFDLRRLAAPGEDLVAAQAFRRHMKGEEVPPHEFVLVTREGRRIDAILTTRLIGYEGAPALLGIVTDISARKRTERLLQSLNAATLAMEQALTPAEIFPSAVRVLSGIGFDSAVFMACTDSPRLLRTHCRGSGVTAEVSVPDPENDSGPLLSFDAAPEVAQAMDGRGALYSTLEPETLALFFDRASAPLPADGPRLPAATGVIFAPLVLEDTPFGLLVVAGQELGPEDLQVFTAFAHQAAAAWRKTGLMRDLESSLEKLSRTQEQLLHSQKMEAVGRLAGGIAHDFNNLLTVISGYTSLLSDSLEGNPPALSDLGQIRNTIKRASALTSRLLTFSRKQIIQPAVLDLNKVVANSVTLLRPLIGEDIELIVRLAPNALWVRADQGQMDQILMNLAVNARDAMPGGGKLILETGGADATAVGAEGRFPAGLPPGRWALLSVQDDGVGMSEDTREHVFEPFFTTKDEGKGSGIGLSTVYGIVTQSAGRIQVNSAPGRGSTFTIALPQVQPSGEKPPADEHPGRVLSGTGTILLVEDEAAVRELTCKVLERAGYLVVPVAAAREGLLVAEGSTPLDLVVTDVVMPGGMSGVEMGERLSRSRPHLPVLYVSGYTDDVKFHSPAGTRALHFLSKPFQPEELLSRVKAILTGGLSAPRRGSSAGRDP
ncbi:MAG: GAF domain-containing protein [Spirochaetia bacterium]